MEWAAYSKRGGNQTLWPSSPTTRHSPPSRTNIGAPAIPRSVLAEWISKPLPIYFMLPSIVSMKKEAHLDLFYSLKVYSILQEGYPQISTFIASP